MTDDHAGLEDEEVDGIMVDAIDPDTGTTYYGLHLVKAHGAHIIPAFGLNFRELHEIVFGKPAPDGPDPVLVLEMVDQVRAVQDLHSGSAAWWRFRAQTLADALHARGVIL